MTAEINTRARAKNFGKFPMFLPSGRPAAVKKQKSLRRAGDKSLTLPPKCAIMMPKDNQPRVRGACVLQEDRL